MSCKTLTGSKPQCCNSGSRSTTAISGVPGGDFYMPKKSTVALLLEGKTHLLKLLQEIPLGDAEQAAVEEGPHRL